MLSESRQRLAAAQADLVRALVARGPVPAGFDAKRIEAAARSLVSKRRQTVARAWPALAKTLGDRYVEQFTRYAEANPLPSSASPLADGRAFLAWLEQQGPVKDELRIEALTFEVRYVETPIGLRPRRGFLFKTLRLNESPKRVIVLRLPWLGEYWWGAGK